MTGFGAQVEALAKKYQMQMRAVMRTSVQETVSMAQEVGLKSTASSAAVAKAASLGEGKGRMRVDTGFLRASINARIGAMPQGVSVNPKPGEKDVFKYDGEGLAVAITRWQPGEALYIGWTANYARPREYRDGFLRGAVEKWNGTVNRVAHNVRRRI